jgi:hypothetical protein
MGHPSRKAAQGVRGMRGQFDRRGAARLLGLMPGLAAGGACAAEPGLPPKAKGTRTVNTIFDLIGDAGVIAGIQSGKPAGYHDRFFAAAVAEGGTWFFPPGAYHLDKTITMAPGVEFWGAGVGATVIYLGGAGAQDWGLELLNGKGTHQFEAFKLRDITFEVTKNGIRWNSAAGGFTDTDASQAYMMRPVIERCNFGMDAAERYTGLQLNKCFNATIRDCWFSNFKISIDAQGSDMVEIRGNRFDSETDVAILANSHGSFGSSIRIAGNDFNNPKNAFVRSDYLDIQIDGDNHMELDSNPRSTGKNGAMEAMIDITGNAFHVKIHDNRLQPGPFAENWLRITPDVNRYLVSAFNNTSSGPMGDVHWTGPQPYFNNGGGRVLIRHGGNSSGANKWPMNTDADNTPLPPGCAVNWTPGRRGLHRIAYNPASQSGDLILPPMPGQGSLIEISDFDLPLTGRYDCQILAYAAADGQQVQVEIRNGAATASGPRALTLRKNKPLWIPAHRGVSTPDGLKIWLWNDDTSRAGTVWLQAVTVTAAI